MSANENRFGMFIDGPNLWHTTQALGKRIDFEKLLYVLCSKGAVPAILEFFYDYRPKDQLNPHFQNFLQALKALGFKTIAVEQKNYYGNNPNREFKSRTDAMLIMHATEHLVLDHFDSLILISGDSDFEFLTKRCWELKKEVIILSATSHLANNLKNYATSIVRLDKLNKKGMEILMPIGKEDIIAPP
jgi:uncharacterized LabA/DUF88 family protein